MKLAAIQPSYLPWLGHFELIACSDIFVILQDLEFSSSAWVNRNRILNNSCAQWLTIPVIKQSGQSINKKLISNSQDWRRHHIRSIRNSYSSSETSDFLTSIIELDNSEFLIEFLQKTNNFLYSFFELNNKIHYVDAQHIHKDKNLRLIELCKRFECDEYISGSSAINYIDIELFNHNAISVTFQNFTPKIYPQKSSAFISHLSIIDALLNRVTPEQIFEENFFNETPLKK